MTQATARYTAPPIDKLPDDIRTRLISVQEKSGFIPNVFVKLAYRPDEFRAFFAYHDALMEKDSGLTKAEREMIVVATSSFNNCEYCVIAHGAILRIRAKNPLIADQIAVNYLKADITPRQRAMLDFGMKVCREAHLIAEDDFTPSRVMASPTTTSGTSRRSPHSSRCRTGWRISPECAPILNST